MVAGMEIVMEMVTGMVMEMVMGMVIEMVAGKEMVTEMVIM